MGRSGLVATFLLPALLLNATLLVSCQEKIVDQSNNARDSRLEHVQLRQETGFDGKVRSIRFKIDPEADEEAAEKHRELQKSKDEINAAMETTPEPRDITDEVVPSVALNPRSRRSIERSSSKNDLQDLEPAEAKVFRPLFVYRNQVARRLKLRNDRAGVRPKPSAHLYHSYRYSPREYNPSG